MLENNLETINFIPHGHCYLWKQELVWLHVSSDALIALAYLSIPILLIYFVRQKKDLNFGPIILLFGAFIISGGLTHLMNIWTIWHPDYWLAGSFKALYAGISMYAVAVLASFMPKALAFKNPKEQEAINQKLQQEIHDRQQIEEALLRSETRYRSLIEATSQTVWNTNARGEVVPPMPAWTAFTGQTNEEMKGFGWVNAVHPEDRDHAAQAWSNAVANRSLYEVEYRLRRHDGEYKNTIARGLPILEADGSIREWIGINMDITETKEAEKALRESEQKFRATFEQAAVGIALVSPKGQFLKLNRRFGDIVGYTPEEMEALTFQEITHPEDLEADLDYARQLIAGNIPHYSMEKRYIHKNGSLVWINLTVGLERYPSGEPNYMIGVIEDITTRKEAEKALRESEEKYQTIARVSPVGIWQTDAAGNNIYFNNRACEITGLTVEEARGQGWAKTLHPEDRDQVTREWERAVRENRMFKSEYRWLRPDGTCLWVLGQAVALRDENAELTGFLGTLSDITERVQAEAELRKYKENLEQLVKERTVELGETYAQLQENEARYRAIVEDQTELICRYKPDGTLTFVNPAYCRYFNKKDSELVGKSFMPMIPEEDWTIAETALANLNPENPVVTIEHRVIMPDGDVRWQQWTNRMVYDGEGKAIEMQAVGRDISHRRQAEEELKAYAAKLEISNRELQDFAYVASHDLQEPLRKIQAFGDRLNSKYGDVLTDKGRDYLARMQNAAARMQTLIEDLLSFSRVTTKAQPLAPVNLKEIATAVISDLEVRIEETGATVEIGNLPTLDADGLQMRQLFQNLVSNALKFHKKDVPPVVKLEVARQGKMYEIKLIDNGIGFEEKYSDRIFTIFQRLHGRSAYEGTGIGLAVCRKIVERHGGTITARSTPGEGATFIFTLPVKQEF